MRKVLCFVIAACTLWPAAYSFGFSTKGQDCVKCHTLKKDEAQGLLKAAIPNVKVFDIKTTPVKSVWEIDMESDGKKGILYLDFSKRYLFSGSIVDLKEMKNVTQERFSEVNKVNVAQIPLKDAIVLGDRNAKKRVIVFDDPE